MRHHRNRALDSDTPAPFNLSEPQFSHLTNGGVWGEYSIHISFHSRLPLVSSTGISACAENPQCRLPPRGELMALSSAPPQKGQGQTVSQVADGTFLCSEAEATPMRVGLHSRSQNLPPTNAANPKHLSPQPLFPLSVGIDRSLVGKQE